MELDVVEDLSPRHNISRHDSGDITELPQLIAMTVYMVFLSLIGLVGNILVIVSVAISPRLRTTSFAFITNLSIVDLLVNVVVIPLIIRSFFDYGWPISSLGCRVVCYCFLLGLGSSLITLAAIAASRYCFVRHSRKRYTRYCGWKAVTAILVYNWLSAILIILVGELTGITDIHYNPAIRFCYLDNKDLHTYWYTSGVLIYGAVTCFLLIPILYCITFRTVRLSQRRIWAAQNPQRSQNPTVVVQGRPIISLAEIRLTKMMLVIFIFILICWTPIAVIHFFKKAYAVPQPLQRLSIMLVLTNSSLNPYLYAWLNKHFLKAYKRILHLDKCTGNN